MNILLVDTSVQDLSVLVNSCNVNTIGITYSSDTTREELLSSLQPYINNIKRIGLAFHYSPQYIFIENEDIFNENNKIFLINLIKNNNIQHVDFLACNTLKDNKWRLFYENIINETNVILGASDNETGNIKYGGDWIMENTSEDIQNVYFNNNISYYSYLLNSSSNFTCVLSSNNIIYNVGDNTYGQLGYQNLTTKKRLTQMINMTGKTPSKIECGDNFSIILMTDGTIYGTGDNSFGQLGIGNYESQTGLAQMINTTGKTPSDISEGASIVLMTDGTIYSIKYNGLTLIPNDTGKTISKLCGTTFLLMTDGTIYGKGTNSSGQLGLNDYVDRHDTYTQMINTTGKTPSKVTKGLLHTIVLMTDGTIYGTGWNSNGQLGNGTTTQRNTLGLMTNSTGKTPINVFCGGYYTLVLMSDNTIYGCGANASGQLGYGTTATSRTTLIQMSSLTPLSKIPSKICCGRTFTIILMTDNTIYGCGSNNRGQLGDDTTSQRTSLVQMINSTGKTPSTFYNGYTFEHFIVLMSDGTIYGTGQNSSGQLGTDYSSFTELSNSTGKTQYQIEYGVGHTIALMTDGTIYGSGLNTSGQLGLNDNTNRNNFTIMINSTEKIPSKIACGDSYTITLMTDGSIYGTGDNSSGQLGLNDNTNRNNLTLISNSTGKKPYQIACGISHTIILMTDGTIYGTGNNSSGQLGLNDNTNRNNLTLMSNSTGKMPYKIACGNSYTVILMTDGSIYGTGDNSSGQLGLNDITNRNNLTLMGNSTGKIPYQIACGNTHTIILMTDGTIYGIGENNFYQLGINDNIIRNNLTLLTNSTGKTPNKIICGNSNTMIFMSDNTAYSIGYNRFRQLGVGTSQNVTTLTQSLFPINFSLKLIPYLNNFSISSKTFGDSSFDISDPSSNSSGSFSYSSSNTSVATISGKTITIVGAGTTTILATQAEDINYSSESIITTFSVIPVITSPTISNFSISSKTFGDTNFDIIDPSSNSSGSFSYSSSNASVATISGKTITIVGTGTTTITATQAEDSNYYSGSATTTFTVNKASPSITNFSISSKTFGDTNFDIIDPSSNSSGSLSYSSSNTSVATISGKTITIVGTGTTTITATQAEDSNYYSGSATTTFTVNKASPSITNFSLPSKTYGDTNFDIIDPSSNSSGSFSYSSSNTSVATISEKTITIVGTGTTTITANQASTDTYSSGSTTTTFTVNKATPSISNFSVSSKTFGDTAFNIIDPSSNSNGSFSYTSSNTLVADICGNIITIVGTGSTIITATQVDNSNYSSGSTTTTFTVNKASPSISNFSVSSKTFGDADFNIIDPSSNSNGSFSYTSSNALVADICGNIITIIGIGSTTITATQAETSNYSSGSINATLTVNKQSPILSNFSNLTKVYGESSFTITPPTSNSTGSFSYTSSNTLVADICGNIVTIIGLGSATITATQEEDSNYSSGSINATLTVNKQNPILTNFSDLTKFYGDTSFTITPPTSNSTGSFSYSSSDTSVADICGNIVTIIDLGTTIITATQQEDANYSSGTINATLTVSQSNSSLSNFSIPAKIYGDASFNITDPSSNSTGSFSYTSSNTLVADICGNIITILGAGSTTITATQQEDANYSSGTINATLIVNKATPIFSNFTIPTKTYGNSSFSIIPPTSNSIGSFNYTSSNTQVADICGNIITILGAGSTTITASQEETTNYTSGTITTLFTVNKATPSLSNFSIPSKGYGDASFNIIDPSSNSTGSFSYTSSNTSIADISGNIITIIGSGTSIITASQQATNNYNSNTITTTLQVKQATPVITSIEPRISSLLVNVQADNSGLTILGYKYSVNNGNLLDASSNASPILITGLVNKTSYSIAIYSYTSLGLSGKSNTITCIPGIPNAPTIDYIVTNVSDNTFSVYYTPSTITNNSPVTKISYTFDGVRFTTVITNKSPLVIRSIVRGRYYDVRIASINANGTSSLSNTVSSIINGPPPRLTINSVTLFFESTTTCYAVVAIKPPIDGGSTIVKYKYAIGTSNEYTDISGTSLPLIIPNLPVNTLFNIKLIVTNELGGDSVPSLSSRNVRYILTAPSRPTIRTVTASLNSLLVNFTKPSSNGSSITTFKYSLNDGDYIDINSNIVPFSVPIENNIAYTVKVKAVNIMGESDPSPPSKVVSFVYLSPMPPKITSIAGSDQSLIVNFTPPKIRGAPVTSYSYSIDSGTIVDTETNSSPLTIQGLTNGTKYFVTLYANSLAGLSIASNIISGTPILAAPGIPVINSITPLNNSCSVILATPVINGSPITTFLYSLDNGNTMINTNSSSHPVLISGLTNGTTYNIRIIAVNNVGNSPLSLSKSVIPIYSIPTAPVITRLIAGTKRITVYFTPSIPNGSPIIAYYYSFDNGVTLVTANVATGATSFVITGLITSTYTVTLYSQNELGNSPASNSLSVFVA